MGVRIERAIYGGPGAGRDDSGAEVRVPFTLPGELVSVALDGGLTVLEASDERVGPRCRHFAACGGCQYQHAEYGAQVEMKRGILREILKDAGLGQVPEIETRTTAPWGYRNRIRLRVQVEGAGVRLGYSRRASNEFLPVVECPIAAPLVWWAAEALVRVGEREGGVRSWLERVSEVEIFAAIPDSGASQQTSQVQMSLLLRDAEVARRGGFANICEALRAEIPELVGVGAEIDPELGRRLRRSWVGASWGAEGLLYPIGDARYWVSRGAFFQVNRLLVGEMLALVGEGQVGELAWDLFAGVGLFSKALAGSFTQVVAVEGSPVAARDLARLAKNVRAVEQATVEFLRRAVLQRERPELVVMDPPRAGVGVEGCGLLGRIGARTTVYVSCDPVTLGRDLAVLIGAGYVVERVCLVDMFPQTFHIETIVWLRRTV